MRPCPLFVWAFHSNFTIFANSYLFKNHAIVPLFSGNFAILSKMLHVKQSQILLVSSIIVKHSSFRLCLISALLLKSSDVWFTLLFDLRSALVALGLEYCFLFLLHWFVCSPCLCCCPRSTWTLNLFRLIEKFLIFYKVTRETIRAIL